MFSSAGVASVATPVFFAWQKAKDRSLRQLLQSVETADGCDLEISDRRG
jgi:hypothetical protein